MCGGLYLASRSGPCAAASMTPPQAAIFARLDHVNPLQSDGLLLAYRMRDYEETLSPTRPSISRKALPSVHCVKLGF